ncbi:MAG: RNA polymerase sigma factor [Verrucomicrobiota bacterium]|nr:RNA polymerase sigma factor [Verrucomicrobiota bacterium]
MPPDPAPQESPANASLKALYLALETPLLLYAMKITQSRALAEDAVQEAFLRLHVSTTTVREPRPWLYRTVHNLAITQIRSTARESALEPEVDGSGHLSDEAPAPAVLEHAENVQMAHRFLNEMTGIEGEMVRHKFVGELSYKQIAEKTGKSIGYVGYVLHQAMKTLAAQIEHQEPRQ